MSAVLELTGIARSFTLPNGDAIRVLDELDFSVEPGEIVAIVGRSGSGKSTLLNILGLLDTPTSGSFRCEGTETTTQSDRARSRLRGAFFGFIFQQFHLLDRRTALENVAEPLLFADRHEMAQRFERSAKLLEQVGLSDRAQSMPHLLSGGEQQRVAIARALVRKPKVLLADEPTGSLDESTGEQVLDTLINLARVQSGSLILVTHDHEVARRADRVLTLTSGRLHGPAA